MAGISVALVAVALAAPSLAQAAPGDIDPTYGTNGFAVLEIPGFQWNVDVAVSPDGSAFALAESGEDMVLAKASPTGSLVGGFGVGGLVSRPSFRPTDIELSESGDLLVSGRGGTGFGVARYDAGGVPDPAFGGGDGFVETPGAEALVELPNGDIIVLGREFGLTKLEPDGTPAGGFEPEFPDLPHPDAEALALLPDGRIAVAGTAGPDPPGESFSVRIIALAAFNSDGTLDDDFAGGGAAFYPDATCCIDAVDAVTFSEGRLIVFGAVYELTKGFSAGLVAVFRADGSLDPAFSEDGVHTRGPGLYNGFDGGFATEDAIVATGSTFSAYEIGENDWPDALIMGVGRDGAPAPGFPDEGLYDTDVFDQANYGGPSVAEPSGERFLMLGRVDLKNQAETGADLVLTRYELSPGSPDRDGDSIEDGLDRCPPTYGPAPSGCPSLDRRLAIEIEYGSVHVSAVRADGRFAACSKNERVVLRRLSGGEFRRVAVERFDEFGCQVSFRKPGRKGRYAAFVKARTEPRVGQLSRGRSARLRIAPETEDSR